jgi:hypothetical protein
LTVLEAVGATYVLYTTLEWITDSLTTAIEAWDCLQDPCLDPLNCLENPIYSLLDFGLGKVRIFPKVSKSIRKGIRPPDLTPPGAGRRGAFNEAKRRSGIPTSQQPHKARKVPDKRIPEKDTREYDFMIPKPGGGTKTVTIQDHKNGHFFGPDNSQNRGPHFNDPFKGHFDY